MEESDLNKTFEHHFKMISSDSKRFKTAPNDLNDLNISLINATNWPCIHLQPRTCLLRMGFRIGNQSLWCVCGCWPSDRLQSRLRSPKREVETKTKPTAGSSKWSV